MKWTLCTNEAKEGASTLIDPIQLEIAKIEERLKNINGQYMNDLVQEIYDRDPKKFVMIKLGANDGWMCDNLYDFVMKNDPYSIMVEPIPCYFEVLQENFSSLKNIQYENAAVDTKVGTREMTYIPEDKFVRGEVDFRLRHEPELLKEHWARGLGSFYKDKNNLGCPELAKHAVTINVVTVTIDDIYKKYKITDEHNVVIVTDCEGHDHEILKVFDFSKYNPDMYISEIELFTRYPKSHPRRQEYINEKLNPNPRLPPPFEEGYEVNVGLQPWHVEYIQRNKLSNEAADAYVYSLAESGEVEVQGGYPQHWQNKDLEYQQQNGLYTPEEFRLSVEIFENAGYTVLRQSGEDMVAIKTELLENSKVKEQVK
tara:strand:+ start:97 stop:1206 length:1110 start_codon:yes stop_codon:yes gene_type:complete